MVSAASTPVVCSGRPDVSVFEEGGVDSDDDEVITSSQQV